MHRTPFPNPWPFLHLSYRIRAASRANDLFALADPDGVERRLAAFDGNLRRPRLAVAIVKSITPSGCVATTPPSSHPTVPGMSKYAVMSVFPLTTRTFAPCDFTLATFGDTSTVTRPASIPPGIEISTAVFPSLGLMTNPFSNAARIARLSGWVPRYHWLTPLVRKNAFASSAMRTIWSRSPICN